MKASGGVFRIFPLRTDEYDEAGKTTDDYVTKNQISRRFLLGRFLLIMFSSFALACLPVCV